MESLRTLLVFLFTILVSVSSLDFRNVPFSDILAASRQFSDPYVHHYSRFLVIDDQLIIGARDALFRLGLNNMTLIEKSSWTAPPDKVDLCQDKGQSEEDCHNYVNVLLSQGRRIFTCGTRAFSPICTWRQIDNLGHIEEEISGVARAPYSPRANMTALISNGVYFVGATTDFSGSDPAITRTETDSSKKSHAVRTVQFNSKYLNEAQFAGSFETDKFVYFLFREPAVEYINCGKIVYARIARVCKDDQGGSLILKNNWTTFLKARLNCSLPGDYPFYFDEIQGMVYDQHDKTVYATFTTPRNSITGSAICSFNMTSVEMAFLGDFKAQSHPGAAWERASTHDREHFECKKGAMSQHFVNSQRFQLMDQAVQPATPRPIYMAELETLTHIAVETIPTKLHAQVRILYVATADGTLKKIAILPRTQQSCVVAIWATQGPILSLNLLQETGVLLLGLEKSVLQVSPSRLCSRHRNRASCIQAMDPHCGWNDNLQECTAAPDGNPLTKYWHQSVTQCPSLGESVDGGWGSWSPWFTCSHFGDGAVETAHDTTDKCKCRTRECNNPTPQNGGSKCTGISIQVTNCTVHGGWTQWTGWSQCSQTCGMAIKARYRTCGNPAPAHGGRVCVGSDRDEIYCTTNPPCPQVVPTPRDGGWSSWGSWSECSAPCGGGFRMRSRRCDNPTPAEGGQDCPGCPLEYETCNVNSCPDSKRLSAWSNWMTVSNSLTRNGYTEKRFKYSCKAPSPDPGQIKIMVAKEEERFCTADGSCRNGKESEGVWSAWSDWSECSKKCGGGVEESVRTCIGGDDCEGSSKKERECNTHRCLGEWSCWTEWSPCSVTCDWGIQTRTRECRHPGTLEIAGAGCEGSSVAQQPCQMPSCLSAQGWGEWSEWSLCDANDEQHRMRQCLTSNPGPDLCQGRNKQTRMCTEKQIEMSNELPRILSAGRDSEVGLVLGCSLAAFLCGAIVMLGANYYYKKTRSTGVPGSPHYMSKPNPYESIPLRQPPKRSSSSASSNGSSGYKSASPTKLFNKPPDYETATIKRNSHSINGHTIKALDDDRYS